MKALLKVIHRNQKNSFGLSILFHLGWCVITTFMLEMAQEFLHLVQRMVKHIVRVVFAGIYYE